MIQKMIQNVRQNKLFIALVVVVIALVVGIIVLFLGGSSVKGEQASLKAEEQRAQVNLNAMKAQYDLDALRSQMAALQGTPSFPSEVSVVQVSAFLEIGAAQTGVQIDKVSQTSVGNYNITIAGSPSKMNNFLIYLENGDFPTLQLGSLSFTQAGGSMTISIAIR